METVTIQSVTAKKTGAKNGKPWTISEVIFADGRKVDTFDSFVIGETAQVEITPNANPQYNANMKRPKTQGQANAATFKNAEVANKAIEVNQQKDLRITRLSCASSACNYYQQRQGSHEDVIILAQKLFEWAIAEKDQLPF
jgi:hypothetical protein